MSLRPPKNAHKEDPWPAPWSLDPLPPVTPVLLPNLVTTSLGHKRRMTASCDLTLNKTVIPSSHNDQSQPISRSLDNLPLMSPVTLHHIPTPNLTHADVRRVRHKWTHEELLSVRKSVPCHIDRTLRKGIMHLGIWGRHAGCEDNPDRGSHHPTPKPILLYTTFVVARKTRRSRSAMLENVKLVDISNDHMNHIYNDMSWSSDTPSPNAPPSTTNYNCIPIIAATTRPVPVAINDTKIPVLIKIKPTPIPDTKKLRM